MAIINTHDQLVAAGGGCEIERYAVEEMHIYEGKVE